MAGEVTTPSSNGSDIGAPTDKELTWQNLCLAILLCILIAVTVVSAFAVVMFIFHGSGRNLVLGK
jgi:hypothetical protein